MLAAAREAQEELSVIVPHEEIAGLELLGVRFGLRPDSHELLPGNVQKLPVIKTFARGWGGKDLNKLAIGTCPELIAESLLCLSPCEKSNKA